MSYPAAIPALALTAGIAAGVFLPGHSFLASLLFLACWTWTLVAFVYRRGLPVLLLSACGFVAVGMALGARSTEHALRTPIGEVFRCETANGSVDLFAIVQGRLRQDGAVSPAGISLSLAVDRVEVDGHEYKTAGGILMSVDGELSRDRLAEWRAGRVLRFPATMRRPSRYLDPGVRDMERGLAWRGTTLVGSVKSPTLVELVAPATWLSEAAAAVRVRVRAAIAFGVAPWSERSAAVVLAILIGDRTGLDDEVEQRLQKAGTYHVIAISGGNIAIFAALFLLILRVMRVGWRVSSLIVIILLTIYALVVGGGSSVVRATLMAVIYLAACVGDLRTRPANVVAVAASILLVAAPLAIVDAGFLLTFGATLGILIGVPLMMNPFMTTGSERWLGLLRMPLVLLAASVSAELALLPIGAFLFSRVTFAGLLLNFAAIPLMTLVQVTGLATVTLDLLGWNGVARVVGYLAHLGVTGLLESARFVDVAPWLTWRVPPPPLPVIAAYYASAIVCLSAHARAQLGTDQYRRWVVIRGGGLVLAAACGCWVAAAPALPLKALPLKMMREPLLRVTFLDVGQGDAAAINFSDGRSLTIDAGGLAGSTFDIGRQVVTPTLWALGFRRLDYMTLTHGDFDHMGGASGVFDDLHPDEVWEGVPVPPHEPTQALRRLADRAGTPWRTLQPGDRISFGSAELLVWHPPPPEWERQDVRNDDSVVMEVRLGRVSFLFGGDIGREVERMLAPRLSRAGIRVLKVPHHGSATSSSAEFLRAVDPDVAVISSGRSNPYGHPVPAVVQRYRDIGAAIYRTDQDGAVMMETDGQTLRIRTFTNRKLTLRVH